MSKKLLFLSSTNLSSNPRLLKELKFAVKQGYNVDFVGFKLGNWSDKIDDETIKNINANFHYISITRKPFIKWFVSSINRKLTQKIYPYFKNKIKINAYAHSKSSILLNKYLKSNTKKYDLVIAHTLATLYPAYMFAQKTNTKFIFDIEDYHVGEVISHDSENEKERRKFLMKNILPKASFISYASPLIGEHSLKLLTKNNIKNHSLINNCFSQTEFQFKENNSKKIKIIWFSQNICKGRGLELIIPVLEEFKNMVEVNLIGNLYQGFYETFLNQYSDMINIIAPLPQKELNLKLSEFDIGLAIELNSADFNRQICLTNKIFAYAQSGLYVLATDTKAQEQFLQEHSQLGISVKQDYEFIKKEMGSIIKNILEIRKKKKERFNYAQKLSWETESEKLNKIWNYELGITN